MSLKILHSIIFNGLRPWIIERSNQKPFAEKIKKAGTKLPGTTWELTNQLKILLAEYPGMVTWLDKQNTNSDTALTELYYFTDLPAFSDTISKFYSLIISKEADRIFNTFLPKSKEWSNSIDINYHSNNLLKSIKTLIKQTIEEIEDRGFEEVPGSNSDLTHFVLHYLKHSLIILYFSIQEINQEHLEQVISLEDFFLLELEQPISTIQEIHYVKPEPTKTSNKNAKQAKFTFGFVGDENKLRTVISELSNELELVDRDFTRPEDLINVLISKNIQPFSAKIQLGCETTIFRYIVDRFKLRFTNLTFISIENSGLFYSKKNNQIKATNLSVSKVTNPKNKELLDEILNKLG